MTAIRRTLLLTTATTAVLAAAVVPAQALFDDVEHHSGSVATATVAPPTNVAVSTTCDGVSATVTVTWTGSSNARRTGYRVTLSSPGLASPVVADTGTTTTSATVVADQAAVDGMGTVVVETRTNTVWTGASAPTGPVTCPAPPPPPPPSDTTTTTTTPTTTTPTTTTTTESTATTTDPAAVPQ